MADTVIQDVAGLQLSNNTFSASPPGSQSIATNLVVRQKGVAEPRNGQNPVVSMDDPLPLQLTEFQEHILVNAGTSKTDQSYTLGYFDGSSITPYSGTYDPVDDNGTSTSYGRMKFAFASLFLHFCTRAGPKVLENYNGTPRASGLLRQPDSVCFVEDSTTTPFHTGFLPYNASVAYRTVLKRATSSGQPLQSPPSNRVIATNRILVPVGGLVRTSGTTVTATLIPSMAYTNPPQLQTGDTFTLTPGETDFATGSYTVASTPSLNSFTFASSGSNVASTQVQDANVGTRGVEFEASLSEDAKTGDTLQLYRSVATSVSTTDPSDDLYLANERSLTSGDITAGSYTFLDNTPESVISNPLYTSPDVGEGLDQINFQPPIYRDVVNWDGQTWYSNTTGQHSFNLEMLGVGAPNGVQDGDTIHIGDGTVSQTFTFKDNPVSAGDIQITSDGDPAYNIMWTSQVLTTAGYALFRAANVKIGMYGDSTPEDFPGKLLIERTDFGPQFTVTVSRPESWTPGFPTAGLTSDNARQPNALANSKLAQPESVPAVNFQTVGSANYNLSRILGLRNALLIFKEGDGIWSLSGPTGAYTLQQISTANIIAPDCCAVFSDNAWVYTDQGILRVSATGGAQVVSRPIETVLQQMATLFPNQTYDWSFAIPYETDRRIMFYVPVGAALTEAAPPPMEAYCYCLATNAWTKIVHPAFSGIVSTGHELWTGIKGQHGEGGQVTQERKTGSYLDIADADYEAVIALVNYTGDPSLILLGDVIPLPQVGDGITQGIWRTKIKAVRTDIGENVFQLAENVPFIADVCTVSQAFPIEIQFLPQSSPASRKVLTRLAWLFKPEEFANYFGVTTMFTDQIQDELEIPTPLLGYGLTPYGVGTYGTPSPMIVDVNPIAPQWTNAGQFFPGFKLQEVWVKFKCQGVSMTLDGAAGPTGRGR